MNRITEEMKLWLFDLAHGNLDENEIIKGFIKHYVLFDLTVEDVKRDIIYRTVYGAEGACKGTQSIQEALKSFVR